MRAAVAFVLALLSTALATACGGDDEAEPLPTVPRAKTETEWANRLAGRFLLSVEDDLSVIGRLSDPSVVIALANGDRDTVGSVERRMTDLERCSAKLARVGPPPSRRRPLTRVHNDLRLACADYERVAGLVLDALPLIGSGDPAKQERGRETFARAREPSRRAALHYGRAIRTIEKDKALREVVAGR